MALAIGLTNFATLRVTADPYSIYPQVREVFQSRNHFLERARQFVEGDGIAEAHKLDLVERLSTLFHEYQHFQDLMCTVFGRILVRQQIRLTARYCALVNEVLTSKAHGPLEVPLRDPESLAVWPQVAQVRETMREAAERARVCLELSAIRGQRLATYDVLGLTGLELLVGKSAAFEDFPYSEARRLEEILVGIFADDPTKGNTAWAKLVLICLSSTSPDSSLEQILSSLRETRATAEMVSQALDKSLAAAKDDYAESLNETDRLADMCRAQAEASPKNSIFSELREFAETYREVTRKVQQELLESDFSVYTDGLGVFEPRDGWPTPWMSFATPYAARAPVMPLDQVKNRTGFVYKESRAEPLAQVFVCPMDLNLGYQPFDLNVITQIEAYCKVGEVLVSGSADPIALAHLAAFSDASGRQVLFGRL